MYILKDSKINFNKKKKIEKVVIAKIAEGKNKH